MERKKAFQMRERFDRAKTPMGSVPISVIMGFDYPLLGHLGQKEERGGRGEAAAAPGLTSSCYGGRDGGHSSYRAAPSPAQRLNTDYMNVRMLERLPRSGTPWPASLASSRSRAVTEAREAAASSRIDHQTTSYSSGFTSSFAIEHPKQQPCR